MKQDSRIIWVDIFKGLAILSVVFGHCGCPITATIYMFHMTAFFFISGYTTNLDKYSLLDFTQRRIRSLIVPFIGLNLTLLVVWLTLAAVGLNSKVISQPVTATNCINHLRAIIFRLQPAIELGGASWFVVALFCAALTAKLWWELLKRFNFSPWVFFVATCLTATYEITLARDKTFLPYQIDLGLLGGFFFAAGFMAKRYNFLENGVRPLLGTILSFGGLWYLTKYYWIPINFPGREFSSLYEMSLSTIFGVYSLYVISHILKYIPKVKDFLEYTGKNSFAVLGFHFLGFKGAFLILIALGISPIEHLSSLVPPRESYDYWTLFAFMGVAVSLLIARFLERYPVLHYLIVAQDSKEAQTSISKALKTEGAV